MNMPVHPLAGQPLELADTLRSGNAWKIRLACGYMGLALRRRTFDIVQGDLETGPLPPSIRGARCRRC